MKPTKRMHFCDEHNQLYDAWRFAIEQEAAAAEDMKNYNHAAVMIKAWTGAKAQTERTLAALQAHNHQTPPCPDCYLVDAKGERVTA